MSERHGFCFSSLSIFFDPRRREKHWSSKSKKKRRREEEEASPTFSFSPLFPAMASTAQDSSAPLRTEKKDEDVDESAFLGGSNEKLFFEPFFFFSNVHCAITPKGIEPFPTRFAPKTIPMKRV